LVAQWLQASGVFERGSRIMDRAGTNDDQQAVILPVQDVVDGLARLGDELFHRRTGDREKAHQVFGWRQHGDVLDAFVVGLAGSVCWVLLPGVEIGFGVHRGLLVLEMKVGNR